MDAAKRPEVFTQLLGFKRESWTEGKGSISLKVEPWHLNASGVIHGGVLVSMLDVACGMTGLFCTQKGNRRHSVTVSLTTNFIGQASSGIITATGRMTSGGRKIYFAYAEIHDEKGKLIASGSGVHRYRTGSEKPEGVPK
jgi:uncharacterized protein (TIGR00369 family)